MPSSRRSFASGALPFASLAVLLAACPGNNPSDAGDAADASDASDADPILPPPPMMCRPGAGWSNDRPAFTNEGTGAWGLTGVTGVGLTTADLDNDGYPDLVAYDSVANARTNLEASPPVYHMRVMMNRPRDGGGRTFVDATRESNLLALRSGEGYGRVAQFVVFADVDNDGDVDAYTGVMPNPNPPMGAPQDPGDRSEVMLNDGRGRFTFAEQSDATPSDADAPQTIGAVWLDQNRDGNVDLFVGYHSDTFGLPIGQQPQLFRGEGNGRFTDVTDAVGITLAADNASLGTMTNRRPLYGVSACDVNNDGVQDLIGAAYGRQFNLLFVSDGARYVDQSVASGVGGDMNRDYSDNLSYQCFCAAQPGRCPSTVPAPPAGFCPGRGWRAGIDDQPWRNNGNSFSIACGDVDNDGDTDLVTGEIAHPDVGGSSDRAELLVNQGGSGPVRFTRPGRMATGIVPPISRAVDEGVLSNAMFDFDNDGRMDVWLGGSDYDQQFGWMFRQGADGRFTEIGRLAGFRHACPHGLALADFDLDGDVDAVVGSSTFRSFCNTQWRGRQELRMYENVSTEANWTAIRLVGRGGQGGANRSAIGARVRVTAGGVTQTREVQTAWGVNGLSSELVVHVGLGTSCVIDRVEVRWPDAAGMVETFTDVRANYRVEIRQGEGRVRYPR